MKKTWQLFLEEQKGSQQSVPLNSEWNPVARNLPCWEGLHLQLRQNNDFWKLVYKYAVYYFFEHCLFYLPLIKAVYYSCDVTDLEAVRFVSKKIRNEFNTDISVIIHGAGSFSSFSFFSNSLLRQEFLT